MDSIPLNTATSSESGSRLFKPHPESTALGFDTSPSTIIVHSGTDPRISLPPELDIGSMIRSILTTMIPPPFPTIHFESSETGWGEATQSPIRSEARPTIAASAGGFGQGSTGVAVETGKPQVVSPPTSPTPASPLPNSSPQNAPPKITTPPVITQGGLTLQPVLVTNMAVQIVDGKPITAAVLNYRYVIGSITLAVGTPTIINSVVVALSLGPSASTILVVGGHTTTLAPAQITLGAQTSNIAQPVSVGTTVVEGTTKYILAGQTLAPGQAVTIGNIPISFNTQSGSTILVMGNVTTTFVGAPMAGTATDFAVSAATTPGGVAGIAGVTNHKPAGVSPSAKVGSGSQQALDCQFARLAAMAALLLPLV
jgi:hypothetical protein